MRKVMPRLLIAVLAAFVGGGCRTAGTDSLSHQRPPAARPEPVFDLQEFVADHNENSDRIQSMEARPTITVKYGTGEEAQSGSVSGRLAVERPRNFELQLTHQFKSNIADIGSNDEKFWFWFQNKQDRSIYYCNYAELSSTSLAVTYQPDWIVEAMGLKAISPDEAAQIRVRPGMKPDTSLLAFPPTRTGGQTYHRSMLVSNLTNQVEEFKVYSPDGKELIAQATIKKYRSFPISRGTKAGGEPQLETCLIPEQLVLDWKKERLSLDVLLQKVSINQFDPSRREMVFVEPSPSGYERVNLAQVTRPDDAESSTAIRETMPVPERSNNQRGSLPPMEIKVDHTTSAPASPRQVRHASERGLTTKAATKPKPAGGKDSMLLPVIDLDVITAPMPTAPGASAYAPAPPASTIAASPATSLER